MKILAIETSCDETAAAVIKEEKGRPLLLSSVVASQINIHKIYGGVVPEVAARAHIENIIPVISSTLKKAKVKLTDIDYFAVTYGPGLVGSLVVGVETAKALALSMDKPLIPLNHLEGHIYANFLTEKGKVFEEPKFPLVCLLVSGGHSLLIYMKDHLGYKVIGETRDDAAGEAFDKGAKALGLGYPGGPIISKLAEKGDRYAFSFPTIDLTPEPKKDKDGFLVHPEPSLDFSFSGLKTALISEIKKVKKGKLTPATKRNLAAGYESAITRHLVQNSLRAVKKYHPKSFILSGGVAANRYLRRTLNDEIVKYDPDVRFLVPDFSYCTDNAAMIGAAAFYHVKKKRSSKNSFSAEPNLKLK